MAGFVFTWISFVVGLIVLLTAHEANSQDRRDTPHPWLADAPGEFGRLIERGGVRMTIDDERLIELKKQAITVFRFGSTYDFRYRVQWLGTGGETPSAPPYKARIIATIENPQFQFEHTIVFRSGFRPTMPWKTELMKHEFDHVSISTDPRLLKLMKKVWLRKLSWVKTFDQAELPSDEDFGQAVKEQIEAHTREFERIIQANYDLLDKESRDGNANLTDRSKFFKGLYTLESLKNCGFLYMDSARSIMQDSLDKDVTEHYLILDPT